jgi:hypothetical protein
VIPEVCSSLRNPENYVRQDWIHQGLTEFVSGPTFSRIVKTTRNQHFLKHHNMAPLTRSRNRAKTPDRPTNRPQYDTIKRTKFFCDYDHDWLSKDLPTISAANRITDRTGHNWLQQRRELESPAYRTIRQRSQVLGRRSRVSKETCKMLVSPTRNPVCDQLLEAQIEYHHIEVGQRQLTRRLLAETDGGRKYKQAYVGKEISDKNITD